MALIRGHADLDKKVHNVSNVQRSKQTLSWNGYRLIERQICHYSKKIGVRKQNLR